MTDYSKDLLKQAELLLRHDKLRPKQANLRRSISAAYYAMFHGLSADASRHLFGGWVDDECLAAIIPRVFGHEQMKAACKVFAAAASGTPPKLLVEAFSKLNIRNLQLLHDVANCFVELQEARHSADYDLTEKFSREDARNWAQRVTKAFEDWEQLRRTDPDALALFALCLLNWKTISQR